MKTVLKYLLAGFLTISVSGLGVLQVVQVLEMRNLKQTVDVLQADVETLQNGDVIILPTESPDIIITSSPEDTGTPAETISIKLYYKNHALDPDSITCEADSYVTRTIPKTATPLTDTIRLLLVNDLTQAEKNLGLENEFHTTAASQQVTLTMASITNGVATLTFDDPLDFTSGGSCRSGILASQVSLTAKQFSTVNSVELEPFSVFQP